MTRPGISILPAHLIQKKNNSPWEIRLRIRVCILSLILGLLVSACSQTPVASPTGTPGVTFELSATPRASATSTQVPATATDTPLPPTATVRPTKTPTHTPGPLDNYPEEGYGPHSFPESINPLTGLPVDDPALLDRRPVAVKVSNGPRSVRPQYGLSLADHVWEYYHEVGRTRFNAIFYGQDAEFVGPIRSARFADEHIIQMYKSIFAFGSADARVLWRLFNTGYGKRFEFISDHPCPPSVEIPLCRTDPDRYNSLMTDTAAFSQHFTNKKLGNFRQVLDGLVFKAQPPGGGTNATSLTIRYSSGFYNRWDYDSQMGKYLRFQDTVDDYSNGAGEIFEPLIDRLTGDVLTADNVVVILARQTYFLESPEMWEINLLGSGDAYLFRDGRIYLVRWVRDSEDSLLQLKYADGSRVPLKPGSTWFQVVGTSSLITNQGPLWRMVHMMP